MALSFFAIVVSMHLLGSAILFGIVSGPFAIFASPLLSLFGWFFIIPEIIGVSLQWNLFDPMKSNKEFLQLLFASVLVGATFMGLLGPKEENSEFLWTVAYVCAGGAGAAWSLLGVRFFKSQKSS